MGPPPAAPFALDLISRKLIKPRPAPSRQGSGVAAAAAATGTAGAADGTGAASSRGLESVERTELSSFDAISAFLATARAYGFGADSRLDARVLEAAVEALVTDLPFLAGRMGRMQGRRLGTLAIRHSGEGALLTVVEAEDVSLSCMAPDTWPQPRMALSDQEELAFYIDRMDTSRAMLLGREPVMKVRLTQLKDGQILGITLSHAILDGMRWPALEQHLAARYRQYAGSPPPDPSQLLHPTDRRLLSAQHMAGQLLGEGTTWKPPSTPIRGSLSGYWRLASQAWAATRRSSEFVMLHLPRPAAAELKALAAEGSPVPGITTGDAVQAAVALLLHAALGRPLLPVAPKAMAVMVQVPTPEGYFGNAVRMLEVSLPAGTEQPDVEGPGRAAAALSLLAGAIRRESASFRSQAERALEAMASTEALVDAPLLRMLSYMCGELQPHLTSATNYNPTPQTIDLGVGPPVCTRQVSVPRARNIAIIRPAVPPYCEGLFIQVCMDPKAAHRLKQLPLLADLLPFATACGHSSG